jgi:UDP-glucose 4-epimerase
MSGGRALVTGGAGFIGSHLADGLLAAGSDVIVLDDLSTGSYRNIRHLLDNPAFRFVEGSVLDSAAVNRLVEEVDTVYHLAAAVGVQLIIDKPLESMLTNIRGTEVVLEAVQRRRAKVLIASTSEIYGKAPNGDPFAEDDDRVLGPTRKLRWSYATSKAVDEILAFCYHRELGLHAVVARLFNTIGPRQTGYYGMVVPRLIGQALRNRPLTVYGDGRQSRVFTYVTDVVHSMLELMATPASAGEAFNIAGQDEISIADLARVIIAKTGSRSDIVYVPYEEVYGEGFEDMTRRRADTRKLRDAIGFAPETPLDAALDRMIEFAREAVVS